jgi:hypothetical protein
MVGTWKAMLCCPRKLMFPKEGNVVETMFPKLLNTFPRKHWGTIIVLLVENCVPLKSINVPLQNIIQPS